MLQSVMMQGTSSQHGAGDATTTPDKIAIGDYYATFGFRTNSINRTLLDIHELERLLCMI